MKAVSSAYYEFHMIVKLWNQWHSTSLKLVLYSSDSYPVSHNEMSHAVSSCPLKGDLACALHPRTRAEAVWTFQRIFNQLLQLFFSHWLEAVHRQLQYCLGQLSLFKFHTEMAEKRNWCFGPRDLFYRDYTFLLIGSSVSCLWRNTRSGYHKTMPFGRLDGCCTSVPVHGWTKKSLPWKKCVFSVPSSYCRGIIHGNYKLPPTSTHSTSWLIHWKYTEIHRCGKKAQTTLSKRMHFSAQPFPLWRGERANSRC